MFIRHLLCAHGKTVGGHSGDYQWRDRQGFCSHRMYMLTEEISSKQIYLMYSRRWQILWWEQNRSGGECLEGYSIGCQRISLKRWYLGWMINDRKEVAMQRPGRGPPSKEYSMGNRPGQAGGPVLHRELCWWFSHSVVSNSLWHHGL